MSRNPLAVEAIAKAVGLKTWPSFVERASCDKKEIFLNGGWRGGKSASASFIVFIDIILKWLHVPLPVNPKTGQPIGSHLIWLVGPDYAQAREEYRYLYNWAERLGWDVQASAANNGPLTMRLNVRGMPGVIEVATKSADDPTSLGSVAPVLILACEAGQFSEEVKEWLEGRAIEKNAGVIWSGTFHNDKGNAQYEWYERLSLEAWKQPTPRQQAFRLPSWENLALFGDCTKGENSITNDPTLEMWCPDKNHGPAHSEMNHPKLREQHARYEGNPKGWAKRYGGEPTGIQDPIYEWAIDRPTFYLKPMPDDLREAFRTRTVSQYTAGGIDPGLVHPAALTVGSQILAGKYEGITWVRGGVHDTSGSAKSMWDAKDMLRQRYGVQKWGGDPVGLQYTREYEDIEAMRGSLYSRMARVKICNGVAQDEMVFFDSEDPYVRLLFAQIQRVHMRKDANGQLVYDRREDDDMVASWEDMMAMLHGQPVLRISRKQKLPAYRKREPIIARSAS